MDISTPAVSPLRQRMIEDMRMRRLEAKTQQAYVRAIIKLSVRISAIVDACFRLIADGVSAPSWTRGGCAQADGSMYLSRPRSV
jgi:hypothetical protein